MTAAELAPDMALKELLDGNVVSDKGIVEIFAHASMPNDVSKDDFISLQRNGIVTSETEPMGVFKGNVALTIYCRLYSDNTANVIKSQRLAKMCETLVNRKIGGEYFFKLDATNPITPTTGNATSGYSITTLNVAWRTPIAKV